MLSGSNNRVYMYHVLAPNKIKNKNDYKKTHVSAPILKRTYDQKLETLGRNSYAY